MALEPITRQEKIIAGQDLTPITRMEKFLKQYGGGSGGVTSWNDLTDKPFGDNADGSVTKLSGKYVEGMGYEEDGVVHPIDQQFLPSVGGQFVVTLTMGATGVVSDKTGVEIGEAAKNGSVAIAILNVNESLFVFTLQGFSADEAFATFGRFVLNDGGLSYESVTIQADGTVSMGGAKVQTT